jgi:ribosome biogenesis SPOUT family RNA methylase Rps3
MNTRRSAMRTSFVTREDDRQQDRYSSSIHAAYRVATEVLSGLEVEEIMEIEMDDVVDIHRQCSVTVHEYLSIL